MGKEDKYGLYFVCELISSIHEHMSYYTDCLRDDKILEKMGSVHSCRRSRKGTHLHVHMHAHTWAHARTHYTHAHITHHIIICTLHLKFMHVRTHALTYTCIHKHMCARARTHTHTFTASVLVVILQGTFFQSSLWKLDPLWGKKRVSRWFAVQYYLCTIDFQTTIAIVCVTGSSTSTWDSSDAGLTVQLAWGSKERERQGDDS